MEQPRTSGRKKEEAVMKISAMIPGGVLAVAVVAAACGGGSSSKTATTAPKATPAATSAPATKAAATTAATAASEATSEPGELASQVTALKGIMQSVIAKANAGDLQGTKDTEGTMDVPMEAIVKAVRPVDAALADSIEQRELAIEKEADATTTDLKAIAKSASEILPLLDQVVTKLKLSTSQGAAPTKAELAADVKSLKTIMTAIIAKAQAGDVEGTRDTEGTMDTAMEAVVTATRAVDPALATTLENLELDIEKQADASNTDLAVIIKDAQAVPAVLDKVVTALKLTP
jgi:hypothetical protein